MSLRRSMHAFPTMLRTGFAEALAYRAEMLVWILSTTMPLVMLAIWHAVARDEPIGRFGGDEMIAYFLATFIVRQLTGSWLSWMINSEVKDGTLGLRLLRPVHPLLSYAADALAALPVRGLLSIPIATVALVVFAGPELETRPALWVIWLLAVVGGWLITLAVNLFIGCLAMVIESSNKVMDVWLALYFVFSGYMLPVELFPPWLRAVLDWLPFRYQLGLPVELMTGAYDLERGAVMLGRQWLVVAGTFGLVALVWRAGVRRFAAFGG
jgi:ABC-2 type transport system permease protein